MTIGGSNQIVKGPDERDEIPTGNQVVDKESISSVISVPPTEVEEKSERVLRHAIQSRADDESFEDENMIILTTMSTNDNDQEISTNNNDQVTTTNDNGQETSTSDNEQETQTGNSDQVTSNGNDLQDGESNITYIFWTVMSLFPFYT